jgi:hypothetical protein
MSTPPSHSSYSLFWSNASTAPANGTVSTCSPSNLRGLAGANGLYGCIWSDSFAAGKSVIDAAIAHVGSAPSGGQVYWQVSSDIVRRMSSLAVSATSLGHGLSPKVVAALDGSVAAPSPFAISRSSLLYYMASTATFTFSPGASFLPGIGFFYANSSVVGSLLQDLGSGQPPIAAALNFGAAAAAGHATEPCENLQSKVAFGEIFVPRYLAGDAMVNAIWAAFQYPSQDSVVGDPLARFTTLPGPQPPHPGGRIQ